MSAGWAGLNPYFTPYARWIYQVAEVSGFHPALISGYRSVKEQQILYDERQARIARNQPPGPPVAVPGDSFHNYGLAIDMQTATDAEQAALGRLWESLGFRWGGAFNDPNHFDVGQRWKPVFLQLLNGATPLS